MAVRQQTKTRIKGYQKMHAKKRAFERFGVKLSSDDYDTLLNMIAGSGEAHLVRKLTNTRSIFNMAFQGKDLFALYNSKSKRIVTFLTKEQLSDSQYSGV